MALGSSAPAQIAKLLHHVGSLHCKRTSWKE